ncbi:hypothetical protein C2G38_2162749 [Gigaspora rosea]|uniref:Uncharacterized protein n=1 Tax=Gigaspora rosea TaxID=44941 RepID=A0A397VXZ2_9GLOM|nr:hypothetical protein C2G38_2162749 [Gigaspora rosea]
MFKAKELQITLKFNSLDLKCEEKNIKKVDEKEENIIDEGYIDSAVVVESLRNRKEFVKEKNYNLKRSIRSIIEIKQLHIEVFKIKGHSNNRWNDRADSLASESREGSKLDNLDKIIVESPQGISVALCWNETIIKDPTRQFIKDILNLKTETAKLANLNNNVICLTFDEHGKLFYNGGIVEIVDFLWDFERYAELKRRNDNEALIKGVVEVEEKINKVWSIKQRNNESILMYTYHYETLVALVKGFIKDYEEMYWYIFGLKKSYRWNIEVMCPVTYEEAKDLALCAEVEGDDKSIDEWKSSDKLDHTGTKIKQTNIKRKNIPEVEIEDANEILDLESRMTMFWMGYNVIDDMMNVYFGDDENHESGVKEKCCNKPDNDENCTVEMDNCWWDDLESEVDRLLLVIRDGVNCRYSTEKNDRKAHVYHQILERIDHSNSIYNLGNCDQDGIGLESNKQSAFIDYQKPAEMDSAAEMDRFGNCHRNGIRAEMDNKLVANFKKVVDVTWKRKVDNSIRILLFWMNLMSVILNSYLRQVDGQLNKTNEYVKVVEGGTRTIDIDDVQRKQKAVGNEVSKVDFDHEIPALEKLSESENYVVDDEFLQNIMMGLNIDSYASLDCDQRVSVSNHNSVGNINYGGYIINDEGFERNYEPNRGDIDFEDEVHGDLAPVVPEHNGSIHNWTLLWRKLRSQSGSHCTSMEKNKKLTCKEEKEENQDHLASCKIYEENWNKIEDPLIDKAWSSLPMTSK